MWTTLLINSIEVLQTLIPRGFQYFAQVRGRGAALYKSRPYAQLNDPGKLTVQLRSNFIFLKMHGLNRAAARAK